jgi:hypothetical protein
MLTYKLILLGGIVCNLILSPNLVLGRLATLRREQCRVVRSAEKNISAAMPKNLNLTIPSNSQLQAIYFSLVDRMVESGHVRDHARV